jgi:hypothetical protein
MQEFETDAPFRLMAAVYTRQLIKPPLEPARNPEVVTA